MQPTCLVALGDGLGVPDLSFAGLCVSRSFAYLCVGLPWMLGWSLRGWALLRRVRLVFGVGPRRLGLARGPRGGDVRTVLGGFLVLLVCDLSVGFVSFSIPCSLWKSTYHVDIAKLLCQRRSSVHRRSSAHGEPGHKYGRNRTMGDCLRHAPPVLSR